MKTKTILPLIFFSISLLGYGIFKYSRPGRNDLLADWKNPLSWIDHSESMAYMINGDSRKPASIASYKMVGDCDGFPRVDLSTASGFCVGIVRSFKMKNFLL